MAKLHYGYIFHSNGNLAFLGQCDVARPYLSSGPRQDIFQQMLQFGFSGSLFSPTINGGGGF